MAWVRENSWWGRGSAVRGWGKNRQYTGRENIEEFRTTES
jgi:hypothetical protein